MWLARCGKMRRLYEKFSKSCTSGPKKAPSPATPDEFFRAC